LSLVPFAVENDPKLKDGLDVGGSWQHLHSSLVSLTQEEILGQRGDFQVLHK